MLQEKAPRRGHTKIPCPILLLLFEPEEGVRKDLVTLLPFPKESLGEG